MTRNVGMAIAGIVVLVLLLAGIKIFQIRKMVAGGGMGGEQAETVTSAVVQQDEWPPTLSAIGSISAVQGATVSTELPGTVAEIRFQSGSVVKKGELLVRLDASSEEAQLRSAEADLELARADLERSRDLAARKVISKAELDAAESKFKQKNAGVDNMRAMIAKKAVHAPFDGVAGIRAVNVGQMVKEGEPIVPMQTLDPVYVDFALPQQMLADLSAGLTVRVTTDAVPGREFTGKLTAINSGVDPVTRNVAVQGTLENSDHVLRPGMFGKAEVFLPKKNPVLFIPATAIAYAPFGDSVYVIEKKKDEKTKKESQMIRQQFIQLGETRGDRVSVTKGLKAGETVVSDGVFKLRNGMVVKIDNKLAPKAELSPTPADT